MYKVSFRCYFDSNSENCTNHYQELKLKDIPKWVEAYKFTHPNCTAITVKIWFHDDE